MPPENVLLGQHTCEEINNDDLVLSLAGQPVTILAELHFFTGFNRKLEIMLDLLRENVVESHESVEAGNEIVS